MNDEINKIDSFVSVVSVIDNDESLINDYIGELNSFLHANFVDYEIVLIDQRSTDKTQDILAELLHKIPSIRNILLTTKVHHDVALAAGLENAIGDFVILHSIKYDPVESILDVVKKGMSGHDIVIGSSDKNMTLGYKIIRPWIQWILKYIGYNLPKNATELRCLSRRTVNAVTQTGRFHHQLYVRINKTGYPFINYKYNQLSKPNQTRSFLGGIRQAIRLLVFNSTKPLRWMSALGITGSLLAFIFAIYSILIRFFKDNIIEGWTTMILFTSLLFMILFVILAFLGEYLGRLLDDRSEQNDYAVVFEKNSSVMLDENRANVLKD